MLRRLVPLAVCVPILVLAGCAAQPQSASSVAVSTSLGARSLPAIKLPPLVPGPLDGQATPRAQAIRRPLAIIIENYAPDSRPQSGLSQASTVIETLAEGGITRFMAIYLEKDANRVGPVRSTRMYFDNWAAAFHAILAHVGGNDDAQAMLWHLPKVFNIDENRWEVSLTDTGTNLFWRSSDRVAPHNMYVNTATLRGYAIKNQQDWAYTNASFPHKAPAPLKQRGHATTIDISFQDPLNPHPDSDYAVQYQYNRASNTYLRFMGGQPHVDVANGKPIAPSNVIIMRTGQAVPDPNAGITPDSILIPTIGSGQAWFFRDGKVATGTWRQANQNAPLEFFNAHGGQVTFNPGQSWIEVVPPSSPATWTVR